MYDKLLYLTALGFVPYQVAYHRHGRFWSLQVRALFWQLSIARLDGCCRPAGRRTRVTFGLPLITRLRDTIWSAVRTLIDA